MDNWRLILGPPGTGKTTSLLAHLADELRSVEPEDVAFVTFTRAARADATARAISVVGDRDRLRWFRTVHSTAFRLLGLRREDVMGPKHWTEFAEKYGYDFSDQQIREDDEISTSVRSEDDVLIAAHSWAMSTMLPLHTIGQCQRAIEASPFGVDVDYLRIFSRRYHMFKQKHGLLDFHDMLYRAMGLPTEPFVRVAFVDEAQDLSPVQVKLCEKWFGQCERVYVAGDDDQAIMSFQSGSPRWLLKLSKECEVRVLSQSYRVPRQIHAVAQEIVAHNKSRVPKRYAPRDDDGKCTVVYSMEDAIDAIDKSERTFVLGRNWSKLKPFAEQLALRGILFIVENHAGWSPIGRPTVMEALRGAIDLRSGHQISQSRLVRLLDQIPTKGNLPRGVKKKAKELDHPLSRAEFERWGLRSILRIIDNDPIDAIMKISSERREYLRKMLSTNNGRIPKPRVVLTSIHAAKGREADTVIVLSEMSKASYRELQEPGEGMESEHRVAYVAVTRAKRRLVILHSYQWAFPYESMIRASLDHSLEISRDTAETIVARHCPHYTDSVKRYVIETWHNLVAKSDEKELYEEGRRFRALFKGLKREGMDPVSAAWSAYVWVSQLSRQQTSSQTTPPTRPSPSTSGAPGG